MKNPMGIAISYGVGFYGKPWQEERVFYHRMGEEIIPSDVPAKD